MNSLHLKLYRLSIFALSLLSSTIYAKNLREQNEKLFQALQKVHNLSDAQMRKIRSIFKNSGYISQGNPNITKHPVSTEECKAKLEKEKVTYENEKFESICKDKYMAPLYNTTTKKEKIEDSNACIDMFEFPNIPCDYPVVWVRAKEAQEICAVMGKRMCDAHEWEGACASSLEDPDYPFSKAKNLSPNAAFNKMRHIHNKKYKSTKSWSYGFKFQKGVCAANSTKSPKCNGGNWKTCGSNTYPSGYFPNCRSKLAVYDLHGNAAEHMNLPLNESQMTSKGSKTLGQTEMKGSWFIWDKYQAHQDWCRWRAPYWHGTSVMSSHSHHNYHLGFRCCKTVGK